MKLLNIPLIVLTISTISGILLGCYIDIAVKTIFVSFFLSICALGISWKRSKKMYRNTSSFTVLVVVVFILFGVTLVQIHNPKNYSDHYSAQIHAKDLEKRNIGIRFCIKERLKSTSYYNKYIVSIKFIGDHATQGTILLQFPKDTTQEVLDIGNTYTVRTSLKPIPKPLNPNQFDYAKYLSRLYIFHQITVQPNELINTHTIQWSLSRIADQIRKNINQELSKHNFRSKQLSIINALFLGQRQDINKKTYNAYIDAGAIHILAVSGLHIGILLLILDFTLKPLHRFKKNGKIISLILSMALLWCFAIIAGLSPSILRAATMFSFLTIGIQIQSKTSIYNSLFTSMFILLCFNPLFLFSVGFQLSYLAVFAIVWIQPLLVKIYRSKFFILRKLWETFTVTIAAQLGLLPLTLYYFHQFPLLFFISNLIIVPFLGGILGFGILVILLASLHILPDVVASLFGKCIDFMNTIIGWVAQQETFLIKNIPFSKNLLISLYLLIIALILLFQKYEKKRVYRVIFSFLLMTTIISYEIHVASNTEELIIFHNRRNTTLGVLEKQQLKIYSRDSITEKTQRFLLNNYLLDNRATLDSTVLLKKVYKYKNQVIMIIDSTSIHSIETIKPDIILLSDSPKIHLDRVIDKLCPKQIIADASNYTSYIDRWEISCSKYNIPFHRTDKMGYYIVK